MTKFRITEVAGEKRVATYDGSYRLEIKDREAVSHVGDHLAIAFLVTNTESGKPINQFYVTTRDLYRYPILFTLKGLRPDLQYLEIGPGIGEFTPAVAKLQAGTGTKPIAIDSANYHLMREMLEAALKFDMQEATTQRIKTSINRIDILLNPSLVTFYNTTALNALHQNPSLRRVADIVVDNWASSYYGDPLAEDKTELVEELGAFCKTGLEGVILSNQIAKHGRIPKCYQKEQSTN